METIIIASGDKMKTKKIIKFLKELNVDFKTTQFDFEANNSKETTYDPKFVEMILQRAEEANIGQVVNVNPNDFWGSLGLK